MKQHFSRSIGAALVLAMSAGSLDSVAGSTHYRWVNDRGFAVYSDRPPPKGVDYEVVRSGSTLKRVVDADEGAVPLEVKPRVGNEFESVNTAEVSTKNSELCEKASMNLVALLGTAEIKVRNDQGELRTLTPQEKELQIKTAKAQVDIYCE